MGREVLIKAIAQAISSYIMSCFMLPDSLCVDIEQMICRFYWSGDASRRGIPWLKWDSLGPNMREALGLGISKPLIQLWLERIGGDSKRTHII